ncbi:putative F-box domain-containing protein [Helianthus annuus]|nr:putative F-box domain-containing protein [Helianthus annuus]
MGDLRNKSTKEKTANKSKQSSEDVNEEKKTEKRNSDVGGGRKRKRYDAYKALFKSQRIRTESVTVCSTRAEVVHDDIVEQILIRLDVNNLIRCKRVCKSWHSLITSPGFVNRHLNRSYNKDRYNEIGHRRISSTDHHLIGSSNGLVVVCNSPCIYSKFLVGNPLTREVTRLRPPPCIPSPLLCWGFGHDSANDDYAVLVGARAGENENENENPTSFQVQLQVLRLSTNVWKIVGEVKYTFITNAGILCNGALHWIVEDQSRKILIISYDISQEVFKEVGQPDDPRYECGSSSRLGIVKGRLCVYAGDENSFIWLMKEYNVKESWELLRRGREMKYDIVHYLRSPKRESLFRIEESCFSGTSEYICVPMKHIDDPVFMQSLVSPYVNRKPEEKTEATRQVITMGLQTSLPSGSVYYYSSILLNLHYAFNRGGPSGHDPSA